MRDVESKLCVYVLHPVDIMTEMEAFFQAVIQLGLIF